MASPFPSQWSQYIWLAPVRAEDLKWCSMPADYEDSETTKSQVIRIRGFGVQRFKITININNRLSHKLFTFCIYLVLFTSLFLCSFWCVYFQCWKIITTLACPLSDSNKEIGRCQKASLLAISVLQFEHVVVCVSSPWKTCTHGNRVIIALFPLFSLPPLINMRLYLWSCTTSQS